jgi:hypothetical protein
MASQLNIAPAPDAELAAVPAVNLDKLTTRTVRASRIAIASNAPRAPFGDNAYVTSGTRPVGQETEDVLVIVDGSQRIAVPQAAVLLAIVHNVIPRAVVQACLLAQAARA